MRKSKFLFMLRKLAQQKKEENDAIKKATQSAGAKSPRMSKGSRYLGKI